jgi:hypothetical protein
MEKITGGKIPPSEDKERSENTDSKSRGKT